MKKIGLSLLTLSLVVALSSAFTKKTDLYWFDTSGNYQNRQQTTALELQFLEATFTNLDFNTSGIGTLIERGYATNPPSGTAQEIHYTQP